MRESGLGILGWGHCPIFRCNNQDTDSRQPLRPPVDHHFSVDRSCKVFLIKDMVTATCYKRANSIWHWRTRYAHLLLRLTSRHAGSKLIFPEQRSTSPGLCRRLPIFMRFSTSLKAAGATCEFYCVLLPSSCMGSLQKQSCKAFWVLISSRMSFWLHESSCMNRHDFRKSSKKRGGLIYSEPAGQYWCPMRKLYQLLRMISCKKWSMSGWRTNMWSLNPSCSGSHPW